MLAEEMRAAAWIIVGLWSLEKMRASLQSIRSGTCSTDRCLASELGGVYAPAITGQTNQAHRWQRDLVLPSEREKLMSENVIDATARIVRNLKASDVMKMHRAVARRARQMAVPKIGSNDNKPQRRPSR